MTSQKTSVTETTRPRVFHVVGLGQRSRRAGTQSAIRTKPAAGITRLSRTMTPQTDRTRQSAPHPTPICISGGMRRPTSAEPASIRMTAMHHVVARSKRSARWGRYSVVKPKYCYWWDFGWEVEKASDGRLPASLAQIHGRPEDHQAVGWSGHGFRVHAARTGSARKHRRKGRPQDARRLPRYGLRRYHSQQ